MTENAMLAADANILINTCRLAAQRYTFAYQEPIPVEQLVRTLCDNKQVGLAVALLHLALAKLVWAFLAFTLHVITFTCSSAHTWLHYSPALLCVAAHTETVHCCRGTHSMVDSGLLAFPSCMLAGE